MDACCAGLWWAVLCAHPDVLVRHQGARHLLGHVEHCPQPWWIHCACHGNSHYFPLPTGLSPPNVLYYWAASNLPPSTSSACARSECIITAASSWGAHPGKYAFGSKSLRCAINRKFRGCYSSARQQVWCHRWAGRHAATDGAGACGLQAPWGSQWVCCCCWACETPLSHADICL